MRRHVLGLQLTAVVLLSVSAAFVQGGCAEEEEYWEPETFSDTEPLGKDDSVGVPGPAVATDTRETQVWVARNRWEDRDTPEARKAGLAWGENSGLNWDEKYARWIESMERTRSVSGYDTFVLTTPYGRSLPMPKLECSEVAIFLRIAFASWYGLPFYMTAVDSSGTRVYFGHFGARTVNAPYKNLPRYALQYKDYTSTWRPGEPWPKDSSLRKKGLSGADDTNDFLEPGARTGAYMDEVFLNKRVGHFVLMMLDYFGSMNLANSRNTYNLKPDAIRAGDVVVERWQRNGIGHTLVVKHVEPLDAGQLSVELVSGSMPRRQPKWDNPVTSKSYLTSNSTGGEGTNWDGDAYVKLGGGLKRWRVTKNVNGYWMNTWMSADEASWISDTDYDRLKTRPKEFETLLGEPDPVKKRDALLAMINDARAHLRNYPASCSARERREAAFRNLYDLAYHAFGMTREEVDRQYRLLEDYVFAELEYSKSKTCCWNSTTPAMAQIILDYAEEEQQGACVMPTVFRNEHGYRRWKAYAESTGRGLQWREWREDEPCPQRDVATDTELPHEWTPWCSLEAADR